LPCKREKKFLGGFSSYDPPNHKGAKKLILLCARLGGPHHGRGHLECLVAAGSRQLESNKFKSQGNLVFHSTKNPEVDGVQTTGGVIRSSVLSSSH